jgi:hypothetical protein
MDVVAEIDRGREAYAAETWLAAYECLSAADKSDLLEAGDVELLATCAYMLGRDDDYLGLLERAHRGYISGRDHARAVRCALSIGIHFAQRGQMARAGGWLGRAHRALARCGPDPLERGYVLLPSVFEHEARGELEAATRVAGEAVAIAERFGDQDLFALAAHMQGHVLIEHGRLEDGVSLLDQAMVPAAAGELSPIVTGIVYCGVILACQQAHEVRRAREWTGVLSSWCERQPDLVAFTGRCRIQRAEIMQLAGSWSDALVEARQARRRCLHGGCLGRSAPCALRRDGVRPTPARPRPNLWSWHEKIATCPSASLTESCSASLKPPGYCAWRRAPSTIGLKAERDEGERTLP